MRNRNNYLRAPSKGTLYILSITVLVLIQMTFLQIRPFRLLKLSQTPDPRSNRSRTLAFDQSFGLVNDIQDEAWKRMQHRVKEHKSLKYPDNPMYQSKSPHIWYQDNYEPDFSCLHERRIGVLGDGGKWVCNPHRLEEMCLERLTTTGKGCLIYSIGSNGDFSFEESVARALDYHCEIHVFDFGDYTAKIPELIKDITHFHAWGMISNQELLDHKNKNGDANGDSTAATTTTWVNSKQQVFHSLPHTFHLLKHDNENTIIDIFKIDCEGCEWMLYKDWLDPSLKVNIRQVLLELHDVKDFELFENMQKRGFVTFHKEPNTLGCKGACIEYSFLKLREDFFNVVDQ